MADLGRSRPPGDSGAPTQSPDEQGVGRLLGAIEGLGNRLPDPFILFVYLLILLAVVSTLLAAVGVTVTIPGTVEPIPVRPALSGDGLVFLLENLVENFAGFPPLGTVIVILLAVGLCARAGLLESAVRAMIGRAPGWLLPYAVAFVGVSASVAADASFVVVPPLAALTYRAAGRHPLAGMFGGFAAVAAGYSSSIFVTSLDALLAGISTEAAALVPAGEGIVVTAADNVFFSFASALWLPVVSGLVTQRVVEPRLGTYAPRGAEGTPPEPDPADEPGGVDPTARRGLRNAGLAVLVYVAVVAVGALVPGSPLRGEQGGLAPSPLLTGVVAVAFGFFLTAGLAYGITTGAIRSTRDVPAMMTEAVRDLADYIVLIFAISQFIALFAWTNMGSLIAVKGAEFLQATGLTGLPAIFGFIILASVLNLVIVSGSGMWSLLAPIFVPLYLLLGYEPGFVQAAYRIGDSVTQVITPMNPYLLILLGFVHRYEPSAGLGTLISRMAVYVVPYWVAWSLLLVLFVTLDLPVGPGVDMRLP